MLPKFQDNAYFSKIFCYNSSIYINLNMCDYGADLSPTTFHLHWTTVWFSQRHTVKAIASQENFSTAYGLFICYTAEWIFFFIGLVYFTANMEMHSFQVLDFFYHTGSLIVRALESQPTPLSDFITLYGICGILQTMVTS